MKTSRSGLDHASSVGQDGEERLLYPHFADSRGLGFRLSPDFSYSLLLGSLKPLRRYKRVHSLKNVPPGTFLPLFLGKVQTEERR